MAQYNPAWLSFNNPSKKATIPLNWPSISPGAHMPETLDIAHIGAFFPSKTNIGKKTRLCRSHPGGCLRQAQRKGGKLRGDFGDDPADALAKYAPTALGDGPAKRRSRSKGAYPYTPEEGHATHVVYTAL